MKLNRLLRCLTVKKIGLFRRKRLPIRNLTLIIIFAILGVLVMVIFFTFFHKLERIGNTKNKFIINDNSVLTNEDQTYVKKENIILNKILMEGQAFLFEKNELLDNYTRISIENFGLKENVTNPTSAKIREINLPQSDGTNSVPVLAINDISSINYTFNIEPFLKAQCQYNVNHLKKDMIDKTNGIFLIFLVISSPHHFERRKIIRKTWAKHFQLKSKEFTHSKNSKLMIKENIRVIFFMGMPMKLILKEMDEDETDFDTQNRIIAESLMYKDIVQYNSFDEYYRLTDKSVTMLHWVYTQCPRAKFVIKCDDDVYVNIKNLLSIFHSKKDDNYSIKSSNSRNIINGTIPAVYGSGLQGDINRVQRHPDQKHYISHERWPWPTYPSYIQGKCYLITGKAIASLLAAAITLPYLPFEDLYLTGMCTRKAKVPRFVHPNMCVSIENYNPNELTNPCFVRNTIMWETKSIGIMKMSHQAQFKAYFYENLNRTRENSTKSIEKYTKCKTQNFEFLDQ